MTRAELAAHIKGIDENFAAVHDYARETRDEMKDLRSDMNAGFKSIADSQWLGPQGRSLIASGALLLAVVSIIVAVFHL